jgi:hypothetical protein
MAQMLPKEARLAISIVAVIRILSTACLDSEDCLSTHQHYVIGFIQLLTLPSQVADYDPQQRPWIHASHYYHRTLFLCRGQADDGAFPVLQ